MLSEEVVQELDNMTALHLAAWAGWTNITEYLLSLPGVKIDAVNDHNQTALHLAASAGGEFIVVIPRRFVAGLRNASFAPRIRPLSHYTFVPAHGADWRTCGSLATARALVRAGADPWRRDRHNATAEQLAWSNRRIETSDYLRRYLDLDLWGYGPDDYRDGRRPPGPSTLAGPFRHFLENFQNWSQWTWEGEMLERERECQDQDERTARFMQGDPLAWAGPEMLDNLDWNEVLQEARETLRADIAAGRIRVSDDRRMLEGPADDDPYGWEAKLWQRASRDLYPWLEQRQRQEDAPGGLGRRVLNVTVDDLLEGRLDELLDHELLPPSWAPSLRAGTGR